MKEVTPYIQDSLKAFSDRLDDILYIAYAYLIIFISILTYDCIWSIISLFVAGQILNTPALYVIIVIIWIGQLTI